MKTLAVTLPFLAALSATASAEPVDLPLRLMLLQRPGLPPHPI